jgi:hypothetical protein
MKHLLLILFLIASTGYSDSKTDTTITPKKTGGSVIISGGTGQVLIKAATVNVRGSEGAGTTTLTSSDTREQIFNLSAARTVLLPSTGIVKGEKWILKNVATVTAAILTIQSSGANTLGYNNSKDATVECVSLQAVPTSAAHWQCLLNFSPRQYLCDKTGQSNDIAYNNAAKATVNTDKSLNVVYRCVTRPTHTINGAWYLEIAITLNNTTAAGSYIFTMNGILFKTGTFYQTGPVRGQGTGGGFLNVTSGGSNSISVWTAASDQTSSFYILAELDGRPDWAY